jgi:D-alanyl-D-alanine carboxypeptidase
MIFLANTLLSAFLAVVVPPRVGTPYFSAAAVEAQSGRVLMSDKGDQICYPASCTKLMTLLLTLEAVKFGTVGLSDVVPTTRLAALEKPSLSGIPHPSAMKLSDLLKILMVKSGNDVAVMIAEYIAKTTHPEALTDIQRVDAFVSDMNKMCKKLEMSNTHFTSPNGYPPAPKSKRKFDSSTALDMLKLAREIVLKYPEALDYTSIKECTVYDVKGRKYSYSSHNNVMKSPEYAFDGVVDGLKTGYHDTGGFSLILTATKNGKRAIVAVMGSRAHKQRDTSERQFMIDALDAISW